MKEGRSSSTSRVIALATVRLHASPRGRRTLPPRAADVARAALKAGSRRDAAGAAVAATAVGRVAGALVEWATVPGLSAHYQRRKRLIDGWCQTAMDAGFTQVVVLGAGFDALALRVLDRPVPPRAVEIDHPSTQRVKRLALDGLGVGLQPELVAADLATCDLTSLWRDPRLHQHRDTFVVAEGLLMYLPPRRVEELLSSLRAAAFPAIALAFTFMDAPAGEPIRFRPSSRLVGWWLRRHGEPFLSSLDGAQIGTFLSRLGWNLCERVRFTRPEGESAALAERDG